VIERLTPIEERVRCADQRWYELRVSPYRTLDHSIKGRSSSWSTARDKALLAAGGAQGRRARPEAATARQGGSRRLKDVTDAGAPARQRVRYDAMTREQLVASCARWSGQRQDADVTQALIRDLAAHQLELELQNREMRQAQEAMEESRQKLADLYDFAPVVYLAMNERTQILEANLTASALFGIERQAPESGSS
jgi:PAS domain-containing protein